MTNRERERREIESRLDRLRADDQAYGVGTGWSIVGVTVVLVIVVVIMWLVAL
jgi:CHASE3 domain sensor protein